MGLRIALLLALLIPSISQAEVVAVIKAPNRVNIGDLVVLDSGDSVGDNQVWVVDPRAEGRFLELERRIVFAIGTPGAYEFQLIVADKSAAIDQVKHTVIVGDITSPPIGPPTNPPTPPSPPTDPPSPPGDTSVLDAVKAATRTVNDPQTAQALRAALQALTNRTPGAVQETIAGVLLSRPIDKQKANWLDLWRKPVNDAIDKARIPYELAVEQIIEGLVTSNESSSSKLTVFTKPNCKPCDDWKEQVYPQIAAYNWNVSWQEDPSVSTPSFEICHNGQCRRYTGFMSYNTFCVIVASMKKDQ